MTRLKRTGLIIPVTVVLVPGLYASRTFADRDLAQPRKVTAWEDAVAAIEAGRMTTPIVGEPAADGAVTVTFLAERVGQHAPRIVSDVTGWGERADGTFDFRAGTMRRVGRTDWYSLEARVASRARIEYLIAYGTREYRLDPHNPRQSAGPERGGPAASEFVTPGYLPPQEFVDAPASAAGAITDATIESQAHRWRAIVYTPAGYGDDRQYPMVVFLDLRVTQVARALDWLIAHDAIEPVVALFVGSASGEQAASAAQVRAFLTEDLPGWVASRYAVSGDPGRRAIVGISFGAKDALDAALTSTSYGKVGLSIPGRRIRAADIDAIAKRRDRRIRAAILAGEYDRANLETARSIRRALEAAGHVVHYTEVPEGHTASTWINHLRAVLVGLFRGSRS